MIALLIVACCLTVGGRCSHFLANPPFIFNRSKLQNVSKLQSIALKGTSSYPLISSPSSMSWWNWHQGDSHSTSLAVHTLNSFFFMMMPDFSRRVIYFYLWLSTSWIIWPWAPLTPSLFLFSFGILPLTEVKKTCHHDFKFFFSQQYIGPVL